MNARTIGCNVWAPGDPDAFLILEPADVVVDKVEKAGPGEFVAFTSSYTNRETGEKTGRTMFLRADLVWAVSPNLEPLDDEADDD